MYDINILMYVKITYFLKENIRILNELVFIL